MAWYHHSPFHKFTSWVGHMWNNLTGVTENNAYSAKQAQIQRDWEENMSNTSHQRELADLEASGLNPILSSSGNGASTPSGSSASSVGSSGSPLSAIASLISSSSRLMSEANQKDYNERTLDYKEKNLIERSRDKAVTNQLYDKSGRLISTAEKLIKKL